MTNRIILAAAVLALGVTSPAFAQQPQVPNPANPFPANPVATDGTPLPRTVFGPGLGNGRSVAATRERDATPPGQPFGE